MSYKRMRDIAILMAVVFAITIVVYPLIFGTDEKAPGETPVELEMGH